VLVITYNGLRPLSIGLGCRISVLLRLRSADDKRQKMHNSDSTVTTVRDMVKRPVYYVTTHLLSYESSTHAALSRKIAFALPCKRNLLTSTATKITGNDGTVSAIEQNFTYSQQYRIRCQRIRSATRLHRYKCKQTSSVGVAIVGVAISVACRDVLSTRRMISIFVVTSYTYYHKNFRKHTLLSNVFRRF